MSWKQRRHNQGRDHSNSDSYNRSRRTGGASKDASADHGEGEPEVPLDPHTAKVLNVFEHFQRELDARYDKHERLVKKSRDVTIEAKRIIFLLHRIIREDQKEDILLEAERRLRDLQNNLLRAIADELVSEDPYLFLRAYSPGIQEYIEALSYYHYLKDERLITYQEVQSLLVLPKPAPKQTESEDVEEQDAQPAGETVALHLPHSEYILGLADLTGELMRRCINCIGAGNLSAPFELRKFLRQILEGFSKIGNSGPREMNSKVYVLRQSVDKTEHACYAIQVRRGEFPDCKLNPDVLLLGGGGGGGGRNDAENEENCDHF